MPFSEFLRTIDKEIATKFMLKPGEKLCPNVMNDVNSTMTVQPIQMTVISIPRNLIENHWNQVAKSLDCTPLKSSIQKRDAVSYGKRKVSQMQRNLQAKFAGAFDFQRDNLNSSEEDAQCSDSCNDLDRLMFLLGEKLKTATRQEKIKLLTLMPESWSRKKTVDTFGVTDHMVRRSRQLKREKGILADPDTKKGGRALPSDVTEHIIKLYESEEYSRTYPGKK